MVEEYTKPEECTVPETASTTEDQSKSESAVGTVERLDRSLYEWRKKTDELRIQLDLATLDIRDNLRQRREVTENVYLAVRNRLAGAREDTEKDAASLRQGIDRLLHDLHEAYDDAKAVVRRSHEA